MAVEAKLTVGPVGPGLLRLTAPMILGISSSLVAGLLEAWYLGQVSTEALAAYSFTFPVTGALMSLSMGVSIGVSSVLARTVGEGNQGAIRRIATDGLLLAAVIMIVTSVLGWVTIEPLFRVLGADEVTLPLVADFMVVWYFSLVFMALPAVGANAMRAAGDAKISGTIMVSGSLLQMALGPLLIFGLLGLPAMGLQGAAWANLLARVLICGVTLYVLIYREQLLDLAAVALDQVLDSWRRIMVVSIPATATNLVGPISTAIVVSLLAGYSQETVAGFGIASRIEGLFVIPLFALSASIGPFVGQNWGKEAYARADLAMKLSFAYSVAWGLFVAVLLFFAGDWLSALFDDHPDVIATAAMYLLIVPISYGGWGVLMMTSAIFNSLGKPIVSTMLSLVRMFVIYVPFAVAGNALFGLPGIFAAACLANAAMGLVGYVLNRRIFGETLRRGDVLLEAT